MTTIDDSDDENGDEMQKRNRVVALIKSLTHRPEKQQMIEHILVKYQVTYVLLAHIFKLISISGLSYLYQWFVNILLCNYCGSMLS